MPDYIDIHSHLNFPDYDSDREAIIQELKDNNVWTITIGTEFKTSQEAVDLALKYDHLYAAIGLHPAHKEEDGRPVVGFEESHYAKLLEQKKVVAIGECGLDYKIPPDQTEKNRQKVEFEKQIECAVKYNLPLMIHCRDAYPDVLEILKSKQKKYGENVRGNFHFFTSPVDIARQCLDIGFTVSFTGPITFVPAYHEIVEYVPLEKMMTETDAPFAAPQPHRGRRNSPVYVKEIVKQIAEIKGLPLDTVRKQVVKNAFDLFFKNIS